MNALRLKNVNYIFIPKIQYIIIAFKNIFVPYRLSYSLNIMLSSSIYAVAKGISSFFLLRRIPLCKYP